MKTISIACWTRRAVNGFPMQADAPWLNTIDSSRAGERDDGRHVFTASERFRNCEAIEVIVAVVEIDDDGVNVAEAVVKFAK
jgi:hypothetical protein